MGKGIRRAVTAAVLLLFLFSAGTTGNILYERYKDHTLYEKAQDNYVSFRGENAEGGEAGEEKERAGNTPENGGNFQEEVGGPSGETKPYGDSEAGKERAPLVVDFAKLREASGDVQGWIYCEDTDRKSVV